MWGRLLMLAVGAAAGVIGKTIYDEHQASSSSGSDSSEPSAGEDEADYAKEAD